MAGWISSKLKVAENLLQQIDQQAAESLRKNERIQSSSSSSREEEIFKKIESSLPLKHQLPKKSPPSPSPSLSPSPAPELQPRRSSVADGDGDGDWTKLLSSPKPINPVARPSLRSGMATSYKGSKRPGVSASGVEKGIPKPGITADLVPADGNLKSVPLSEPASSSDSTLRVLDAAGKHQEEGNSVNVGQEDDSGVVGSSSEVVQSSGTQNMPARSPSESGEGSDVESDSGSTSDSEEENRRREEMRKRREQMIMKKAAAAAAMAIKEREDVVAKLEGEKQSLEKILEDRERKQAQEATELQTSMIETLEAVEIEKQKHNSTRMEALACLAKLESEMKSFGGFETLALKQHFGKKLMELEDEKRIVQQENLAGNSDGQTHKLPDAHLQKLKSLEAQILDLKEKQENQVQLLKQKLSDEAAKILQDEIWAC